MKKSTKMPRTGFAEWVDKSPPPQRPPLPLTHITKGVVAHDIIKSGAVDPTECSVFEIPLAYFFYGRPAYKYHAGTSVKLEASCPFCFIFDGSLLAFANAIYPFDTGAFVARMYNHVLDEDFNVEDFTLGSDPERPEKLISAAYLSRSDYVSGNRRDVKVDSAKPYELEARSYLELITSPGRNEPDDRIGTIEAQFTGPVSLKDSLLAVVVPHTHWGIVDKSPMLEDLDKNGIEILPYEFVPGRSSEYYHTMLEAVVRKYCFDNGFLV
ncbi:hypothetical protein [Sphingomonas sp. 28-63-12]|uniref:hypothetical protein n=1 Tax=Sphingomonas sp. 28-63-12 TaxID=1970434 RepID=UPI0035A8BC9E